MGRCVLGNICHTWGVFSFKTPNLTPILPNKILNLIDVIYKFYKNWLLPTVNAVFKLNNHAIAGPTLQYAINSVV